MAAAGGVRGEPAASADVDKAGVDRAATVEHYLRAILQRILKKLQARAVHHRLNKP